MPDLPKELHVTIVTITERRRSALLISGYMQVQDKVVEIKGLINMGADAVIVNRKIIDKYNLLTVRLPKTLTFRNADDSINSMGTIIHWVEGTFNFKERNFWPIGMLLTLDGTMSYSACHGFDIKWESD